MISYPDILRRAWPLILANAAVPLLGLVDTAVIGNVGTIADLGAIALGALIFSFVYWGFGFLRMGTTGFVARAYGANDLDLIRAIFGRALIVALSLGCLLVVLQWPIRESAFALLSASQDVESFASEYFEIRIWGAPATLSTFVLMGVLIGLGDSKSLLRLQMLLNGLNILLDIYFAGVLSMGARGIALGTVMAEWITLIYGLYFVIGRLQRDLLPDQRFWNLDTLLDGHAMLVMMSANADIMIRTLLLVFSFAFFTNQSAIYGDVTLAANHVLLQLISFTAFFLDGFAFVAEALVGKAYGAGDKRGFEQAVRRTSLLAFIAAFLLAMAVFLFGGLAISLLTDLNEVRVASAEMIWLAAIYVMLSFVAFQLDGIFIGVSYTKQMRNAAVLSLAIYLLAWMVLSEQWGVIGLWWAMIIYVVARALALLIYYPLIQRAISQPATATSV